MSVHADSIVNLCNVPILAVKSSIKCKYSYTLLQWLCKMGGNESQEAMQES